MLNGESLLNQTFAMPVRVKWKALHSRLTRPPSNSFVFIFTEVLLWVAFSLILHYFGKHEVGMYGETS